MTASPAFTVREIHFTGVVHAGEGELLRRSGLSLGENLFRADLPRAARAIESHPWVAAARISRQLPGTLVVEFLDPLPAGLSRKDFIARIREAIEEATNRLVEAGRQEQAQLFGRVPGSTPAKA